MRRAVSSFETIRRASESASPRSLILMDEIGSSTEPGEGAALARAVLDRFRSIGCLAIATTHYNRLKIYAETTQGVTNAAMEFNEVTLEPTYRLLHGLAGASSNGCALASQSGQRTLRSRRSRGINHLDGACASRVGRPSRGLGRV